MKLVFGILSVIMILTLGIGALYISNKNQYNKYQHLLSYSRTTIRMTGIVFVSLISFLLIVGILVYIQTN